MVLNSSSISLISSADIHKLDFINLIDKVSIDSRTISDGEVFLALRGENFNGADFVLDALKRGARLCIVDNIPKALSNAIERDPQIAKCILLVDDAYKALVTLAFEKRKKYKGCVVGVTGSTGKTTTKEMLKLIMSALNGFVFASKGNQNNTIGAPLSLCNLPTDSLVGIFEMGMNHAGEISQISNIVKPDIAIVTNVSAVHLEFFSDVSAIAKAKAEIFDGMIQGSIAILNADCKNTHILESAAKSKDLNLILFGTNKKCEVRLLEYKIIEGSSMFIKFEIFGKIIEYNIPAIGEHLVYDSIAALTAAYAINHKLGLDIDMNLYAKQLEHFTLMPGRGAILKNDRNISIIDDSYNASPASMRAAIKKLGIYKNQDTSNGRVVIIMGDMLELGENSKELHQELAQDLLENNVDLIFTVGEMMSNLYAILPKEKRGEHTNNSTEMAKLIRNYLQDDDTVLVKGSLGMNMKHIVENLLL